MKLAAITRKIPETSGATGHLAAMLATLEARSMAGFGPRMDGGMTIDPSAIEQAFKSAVATLEGGSKGPAVAPKATLS